TSTTLPAPSARQAQQSSPQTAARSRQLKWRLRLEGLIAFGAAGRDPKLHGANAGQFNILRQQVPHLSFGAGPYFWAGAALARREITVAAARWFARFPESQLALSAQDLTLVPSWIVTQYLHIPVRLGTRRYASAA
ncbi:hypothetical protein AB0N19_36965, partial [Streptomyces sp. NPDC051132]